MRILADENVPAMAVVMLRSSGHDVRQIARSPQAGLDDSAIWDIAQAESRLVLTSDRDFMRRRNEAHFGIVVVCLRQPNSAGFCRRAMDAICEVSPDQWPGLLMLVRDHVRTL